ncbi:type II toxin-antitoxin system Phd/YefM family antitoxin [Lusitaniella coriacea LEGE 07157]|uniref:Antitoxin n=1 Tax=Lusitaniella coriacea LEGE 07157 TaxID=945747 RepID=A0A8J7DXY7_9CYAN|nr:type II toxin-antitoxin system Phd/YefM family antitoxin [Lusitaniella coriacea]MBE9117456.1 type II toxin-antitoxin system Phd/YefM family antitoxin [Lusitaniella coriacea LEGE 07157]
MSDLSVNDAQIQLKQLIEKVTKSHKPVLITGEQGNAVLLLEQDWSAIQETLYLLSIPGMRESIREGLLTPVEECDEALNW